jgi:phenylalanyl-tRNA synthetase beta chain
MLVSRNWLAEYVRPGVEQDEWIQRLTMSGLNQDGVAVVGSDQAIRFEVTSNRPDCLGHIGIAREVAAVLGSRLTIPDPRPAARGKPLSGEFRVAIESPHLCTRFTARLVRHVKVGASPRWLIDRLATVGIASVNNVVDITNYVMLECGQPLHAFDYQKLRGRCIRVREPRPGETLLAIDHRTYGLERGMCVIADGERAVGLGGVMGGAETEVSAATSDVLIEAAQFNPVSIRQTARKLNLHSPASFRFERSIDAEQIDWASRRCCQLIVEACGGELAEGWIDIGDRPPPRSPIRLRHSQTDRVLGISIPPRRSVEILQGLGFEIRESDGQQAVLTPPTWRRDVTREIDLIEEIGRVHGYEQVPDDRNVPMVASRRGPNDKVRERIRQFMVAAGFDEAMTTSVVPEAWSESFSPWTNSEPLVCQHPMLGVLEKASQNIGQVHHLRRSLVPSLLEAFRINQHRGNDDVHLFELASVYLSRGGELPDQPALLALVSQRGFFEVKGAVESLVRHLNPQQSCSLVPFDHPLLDVNWSGELRIGGKRLGVVGLVSAQGKRTFGFRPSACVAELDFATLAELAILTVRHQDVSSFPPIQRDFNFVVAEQVRWHALESTVRQAAGPLLEAVQFKELFRDETKDGPGRKRLLLSVTLRSNQQTLTREQADEICSRIVGQCKAKQAAALVS